MRTKYDIIPLAWGAITALVLVINELGRALVPLGGDFSQIWAAGVAVNQGDRWLLYSQEAFSNFGLKLIEHFHHPLAYWSYPPSNLLLACPLAMLPYHWALALFTAAQIALAFAAVKIIGGSRLNTWQAYAVMMSSPALLISVLFGQFSIAIAVLLIAGIFMLETRPLLAGVLFGLIAIKPQFGVLLPMALVLAGAWRTIAAAAVTVAAICAATTLVFGFEVWIDFVTKTMPQQTALISNLESYAPVAHSVRSTLLLSGVPPLLATAVQALASIIALLATASCFLRSRDPHLRAFVFTLAAVTVVPYANLYDGAVPALGAFALYRSKYRLKPLTLVALALIWLAPALDGVLAMNGIFRFVPLLGTFVLAATLIDLERHALRRNKKTNFANLFGRRSPRAGGGVPEVQAA